MKTTLILLLTSILALGGEGTDSCKLIKEAISQTDKTPEEIAKVVDSHIKERPEDAQLIMECALEVALHAKDEILEVIRLFLERESAKGAIFVEEVRSNPLDRPKFEIIPPPPIMPPPITEN